MKYPFSKVKNLYAVAVISFFLKKAKTKTKTKKNIIIIKMLKKHFSKQDTQTKESTPSYSQEFDTAKERN